MRNWASIVVPPIGLGARAVGELELGVVVDRRAEVLLGEPRREADRRGGALPRLEVRGGDVHDAVRVDLERHLDLHRAALRHAEALELELAEELAALRPVRLALVDADLHAVLAVAA